jgi:hypothetical protein
MTFATGELTLKSPAQVHWVGAADNLRQIAAFAPETFGGGMQRDIERS